LDSEDGPKFSVGIGTPEGFVIGSPADIYLNSSGGRNETMWYKATGIDTNTGWEPVGGGGGGDIIVSNETPHGAVDGVNRHYTTDFIFIPDSTKLYVNGNRQKLGEDYTEGADLQSMELTTVPLTGDILSVDYNRSTALEVSNETPAGAIDGINRTFTVTFDYLPNSTKLYINGVREKPGGISYIEVAPRTIVTNEPPNIGDILSIDYER
jgi:hypothetical protein